MKDLWDTLQQNCIRSHSLSVSGHRAQQIIRASPVKYSFVSIDGDEDDKELNAMAAI